MKKNGFISTTLIYSFLLILLILMSLITTTYLNKKRTLDEYKVRVKQSLISNSLKMVLINEDDYALEIEEIPADAIIIAMACNKGSISYDEENLSFRRTINNSDCTVTWQKIKDVKIKMFNQNKEVLVKPETAFTYECLNKEINTKITFTDKFNVISDGTNECNLYFNEVAYE